MFLGYEEGSKAYRLYDPAGGKVMVSRDVVFDEAAAWRWEEETDLGEASEGGGISDFFDVEHLVIQGHGAAAEQPPESAAARDAESPVAAGEPPSPSRTGHLVAPELAGEESPGSPEQRTPAAATVEYARHLPTSQTSWMPSMKGRRCGSDGWTTWSGRQPCQDWPNGCSTTVPTLSS